MKQVKPCPFECNANDCKDCGAYTYSYPTQTNEEWLNNLPTKEKAKRIINIAVNSNCDYETIVKWLKVVHKDD